MVDVFQPVYEPLYLIYPDPAPLGPIIIAIRRAYLPQLAKLRWSAATAVSAGGLLNASPANGPAATPTTGFAPTVSTPPSAHSSASPVEELPWISPSDDADCYVSGCITFQERETPLVSPGKWSPE